MTTYVRFSGFGEIDLASPKGKKAFTHCTFFISGSIRLARSLALATCYVSLIRSRVRVGPVLCASRITGIPTGLCSRPPYRHQSSYRSLSPIAGWKGSASEPYVKLPPHTAPPRIGYIGSVRRSDMAGSACVGSFRLLHAPPFPS